MDLYNIKTIKYLFNKYNCNFNKSLGQNFLINSWVCPKMVDMAGVSKNTNVIEIGAGIGVLTVELAKNANQVVTIEVDKKLLSILDETLHDYNNIKIINNDILKINLRDIIKCNFDDSLDIIVCANLPYYITSPIIMYLLESKLKIKSITVMVQKEVAERIMAKEGTRNVSVLSLAVKYYSEPSVLFDVSRGNFNPKPDVDSTVIKLNIRSNPIIDVKSEKLFFKVIKSAFSQRRKTAVNALGSSLNLQKCLISDIFNKLDIDFNKRPENLMLENFRDVSNLLYEMGYKI